MDVLWKYLIVLFALLGLYFICRLGISWKENRILKSVIWQVDLKKVFLAPLKLLFLSLGVYATLSFFKDLIPYNYDFKSLKDFSVLFSLFWIAYRWKKELFQKKWHSLSMAEMLNKLSSFVFAILFLLMAMNIFSIDILPLLAFGGIGAAALAFASKDVLSNFFGGAMISVIRPFSKGDFISLPDRKLEGTVEEMGWYSTSIRDKDKRPIYFPNSLFSSIPVINVSRLSHRRVYQTFRFSYKDFVRVVELAQVLRDHLSKHSEIDHKTPLLIYWDQIGESSIEVILDLYVLVTPMEEYVLLKESILQDVFSLIREAGLLLSYPTSSIIRS